MATPEQQAATMIANMPEKTGKSLAQWLEITVPCSLEKHGEIVKWLKSEFQVTHGFANLISQQTLKSRQGKGEDIDLIAAQYQGSKAELKPIFDKIISVCENLGSDFELSPKKAYVSLRHKKQFGLIQPSTKTRVDLGINLKGQVTKGKLEASGSFNSMVSHRIRLSCPEDVDEEVAAWLAQAYFEAR